MAVTPHQFVVCLQNGYNSPRQDTPRHAGFRDNTVQWEIRNERREGFSEEGAADVAAAASPAASPSYAAAGPVTVTVSANKSCVRKRFFMMESI